MEPKAKTKEETDADALAKKKADAIAAKAKDVADKKEAEEKEWADQLPFAVGDKVVYRWVDGGPVMTITAIDPEGCRCEWFNHAFDLCCKTFTKEQLKYADAKKK